MCIIFYSNRTDAAIPENISEYRKAKILSAKKGRQAQINTAIALRAGFAHFGINECDVEYGFNKNGKPFAINYPNLHFSITHSENMSIIAFCDSEIGIDCEHFTKKVTKEVAKRFFTKNEFSTYKDNYRLLWVAKEAYVKYTGKGLALGRAEAEIPYFEDCVSVGGVWFKRLCIEEYDCAICTENEEAIQIIRV